MNAQEKFLFDLNGFIVARHILNESEMKEMNAAIDEHLDTAIPR